MQANFLNAVKHNSNRFDEKSLSNHSSKSSFSPVGTANPSTEPFFSTINDTLSANQSQQQGLTREDFESVFTDEASVPMYSQIGHSVNASPQGRSLKMRARSSSPRNTPYGDTSLPSSPRLRRRAQSSSSNGQLSVGASRHLKLGSRQRHLNSTSDDQLRTLTASLSASSIRSMSPLQGVCVAPTVSTPTKRVTTIVQRNVEEDLASLFSTTLGASSTKPVPMRSRELPRSFFRRNQPSPTPATQPMMMQWQQIELLKQHIQQLQQQKQQQEEAQKQHSQQKLLQEQIQKLQQQQKQLQQQQAFTGQHSGQQNQSMQKKPLLKLRQRSSSPLGQSYTASDASSFSDQSASVDNTHGSNGQRSTVQGQSLSNLSSRRSSNTKLIAPRPTHASAHRGPHDDDQQQGSSQLPPLTICPPVSLSDTTNSFNTFDGSDNLVHQNLGNSPTAFSPIFIGTSACDTLPSISEGVEGHHQFGSHQLGKHDATARSQHNEDHDIRHAPLVDADLDMNLHDDLCEEMPSLLSMASTFDSNDVHLFGDMGQLLDTEVSLLGMGESDQQMLFADFLANTHSSHTSL